MKSLLLKIRALFPSELPNGVVAFNTWADSFFDIYTMPTEDRASVHWALATTIMRLGPQTAFKSKFYFYLTIKAGAAKQIASEAFVTIKEQQQTKTEAKLVVVNGHESSATN